MGYTTKFKGEFIITPYPTEEFGETINLFSSKGMMKEIIPEYGANGLLTQMADCYGTVGRNSIIMLNGFNIYQMSILNHRDMN